MKVTVIGAGYVGFVSAAFLAEMGNVLRLDIDADRIRLLQDGTIPIHAPLVRQASCGSKMLQR